MKYNRGQATIEFAGVALLSVALFSLLTLCGMGFYAKQTCLYAAQTGALAEAMEAGSGQAIAQTNAPGANVSVTNNGTTAVVTVSESPVLPIIGVINLQATATAAVEN